MSDSADAVRRALAYPYDAPGSCYLHSGESGIRPLGAADLAAATRGRIPILASGSNRAPERIAAKFPTLGPADAIPVTRCRLHGFDTVYSAHIARYGAIAATLQVSPGTVAELAVTWLSEAQLPAMHASEACGVNYDFALIEGLRVELANGTVLTEAHAYIGRRGCLALDGAAIALAEIPAQGRRFPALDQRAIQTLARDRLAPGLALDSFIEENIRTAETRLARTEALAKDAVPFAWPAAKAGGSIQRGTISTTV
ncbi:MAG: hypothetical protein O3A96_14185 [Proteobacteria bacterium]|nr:hypothetical protein [Pseudomonadota bacterium]